jgi:large subunit ribosomal protein L29
MKADKVRELDVNELQTQVRDSEEQLFRLQFQMSMGQADGLKKYRILKKDRARMLTVLREREINPSGNPEPVKSAEAKPVKRGLLSRFKKGKK